MTIGLILLAAAALMIFFGLTDRLFKALRIANWVGFILILALAIGVIAPFIIAGGAFRMSVGAYLIPMLFMIGLGVLCFRRGTLFRAIAAEMLVMAVTVLMLFVFPVNERWQVVIFSVLTGLAVGAVAMAVGGTREGTLFAVFGGVAMGELVMRLFDFYLVSGDAVVLGSGMIFDAMIIAAVTGIVLAEIVARIRRLNTDRHTAKAALNFEAGVDHRIEAPEAKEKTEDFSEYFDDTV